MKQLIINIVHLYPDDMNLYGDTGNRVILEKRLLWRGIKYKSHLIEVGEPIPNIADIIIIGGGQDASQGKVERDLLSRNKQFRALAGNGVVMLLICGAYQLFGRSFTTIDGKIINGLGILPIETIAEKERIIGNIVAESEIAGELVGYENHSGRTYLDRGAVPLSRVTKGVGNNDDDRSEGCVMGSIVGTYMHGPVLAKNPILADHLLQLAICRHRSDFEVSRLDDSLEILAHKYAAKRPR